ncbi:MAG: sigma-54-dependent Fis family transcriptional regulator [Chlorobiota bacterium]|jgi:DNA-binding NtrC family response regulator|nr:sigma-54-dependent Fis family transcriptional regulator [Chlorobiota bacterium]QQS67141.1 MAG: sigma-54-dependent Fis family transcriptional regulator [Chlorobiota bacterium]
MEFLIIDDSVEFSGATAEMLNSEGFKVHVRNSGEDGLAFLSQKSTNISLVLLDVRMPGGIDGIETLENIIRFHPKIPVIMLTGENLIDLVVSAIKIGAVNYVSKDQSKNELLTTIKNVFEKNESENSLSDYSIYGVIGRSKLLLDVLEKIRSCSKSMISVLLTGETGVGKDVLARALHKMSPRSNKPLISIDVPNIPATMFESELFGHTRGAFTGASESKLGLVQAANGGTLFLDEIGEFPIELQSKFLRVLDSQIVRKLGSVSNEQVDVRIVSATNRDLLENVKNKSFREDLFYRLRGIEIFIPPLRERIEDIAPLAENFLSEFSTRNKLSVKRFSTSAIELLERQRWNGNVRELKRVTEAASVMTESEVINHSDLAYVMEQSNHSSKTQTTVIRDYNDVQLIANRAKKDELVKMLNQNEWNITRTAAELDMERSTLSKQMKQLGIIKPKPIP